MLLNPKYLIWGFLSDISIFLIYAVLITIRLDIVLLDLFSSVFGNFDFLIAFNFNEQAFFF